jgi:hypothetical protein
MNFSAHMKVLHPLVVCANVDIHPSVGVQILPLAQKANKRLALFVNTHLKVQFFAQSCSKVHNGFVNVIHFIV